MNHTETNFPPPLLVDRHFSISPSEFPFFGEFELHQNCAMALARFSHISSGSKKLDITYVGRASKMDLINTSFPPFESHLHVHPFTLCINLSLRKAKSLHLDPLISSRMPKYVPIPPSLWIPSVFLIFCFAVALILLQRVRSISQS